MGDYLQENMQVFDTGKFVALDASSDKFSASGHITQSAQSVAGGAAQICHLMQANVYYEDTDFSGFVYHANYLKFAERGRSNFLRLAGVTHSELLAHEPPLAFVVSRMEMDFVRPARIDNVLLVETAFTAIKGARMVAEQRISCAGETLWQADVLAACVDLDGRPKRMPENVAAKLVPLAGQSFIH